MALKDLSTPTMITVFDGLLDPKKELPKIKALPRCSALIPDLESSRKGLQDYHAISSKGSPELQKLQVQAAELDVVHDRKARGIDFIARGLMELTDDPEFATSLENARTEILGPKGLLVISSSHGDEAQNAKLVDKRLSDESKELLGEVTIHDRSLGDWVKNWQGVAKELGKVDAERAALEAKGTTTAQRSDTVRARNTAIRTLNAFITMLDMDDPEEELRTAILGPLEVAVAKAERRAKKGAATPDEETPVVISVGGTTDQRA